MNDVSKPRAIDNKPKRENFHSDDDFGEAYAIWRSQQGPVAAAAPAAKPQPQAAKPLSMPPAVPPAPARSVLPRRSEAEREAWNLSTKERFWRAKTSAPGSKAK